MHDNAISNVPLGCIVSNRSNSLARYATTRDQTLPVVIIERDTVGRVRRTESNKYYFKTRFDDGTVVKARERDYWSASEMRAIDRHQKRRAAGLLNLDDLAWWLYQGKIYLTQGHPRPTEVTNFLECRKVLADFAREPFFPKDKAFKFPTVGKRKPPGVPMAVRDTC